MKKRNYNQLCRVDARGKFFEVLDSSFNIDRVKFVFCEYGGQDNKQKGMLEYYLDMPDFFELHEILQHPGLKKTVAERVQKNDLYTALKWEKAGGKRADGKLIARRIKLLPSKMKDSVMLQAEIGEGAEGNNGGIVFKGSPQKFIGVPVEITKLKSYLEYCMLMVHGYYNVYSHLKYGKDAKKRVIAEREKFFTKEDGNKEESA